ncbi:MAG TPA: TlpA disulfide reductase family protein [Bdellovibrionales bacterium]|nr:TlpA disulfide reductase family protein [Bdellovibrionales bacterium]
MGARFIAAALSILLTASLAHATKIKENDSFPSFKLSGLKDSKGVDLEALKKKNKVILVDFWASWCGPCKLSMPVLNKLEKKYKGKGLAVIGINVDNDKESGLAFLKENAVDFPLAFDEGKKIIDKVGVATMPSSYLIDSKGKVRLVHKGFREGDEKKLEEEIAALLSGKKGKKK